jgi:hypothetical protein
MERDLIITRLLNKYEKSMHLSNPNTSTRRVMLQIHRNDFPEYTYETARVRDRFNDAARKLEKENLIKVEWLRDRPVITVIELNLEIEQIYEAYASVGRRHPVQVAKDALFMIESELSSIKTPWIISWRDEVCSEISKSLHLPSIYKQGTAFALDFIRMLAYYDSLNDTVKTTRAFSTACFQNSKRFEREFQNEFLNAALRFHPELLEISGQPEFGDRERLALLGLCTQPELYQLSGRCTLVFSTSVADLAPLMPNGIALPSSAVDGIVTFGMQYIRKIIFIENLTNYNEYLRTEIKPDELIVYHAGFFSPKKLQLLKKLSESTPPETEVSFWADIDLGGFQMFSRLTKIYPMLQPMRMSADDVALYSSSGLIRNPAYLQRLKTALDQNEFPWFEDTIRMILKYGVTIEQEVFLLE